MSEQIWGAGGLIVGAAAGVGAWLNERAKHNRETKLLALNERKLHCEAFLASIEAELQGILEFSERHDDRFPGEIGYDRKPASARSLLTAIELKCSAEVQTSAVKLVEALEEWLWADGSHEAYRAARTNFIKAYRQYL